MERFEGATAMASRAPLLAPVKEGITYSQFGLKKKKQKTKTLHKKKKLKENSFHASSLNSLLTSSQFFFPPLF